MFEQALSRCLSEGLVGGEGFATDASAIKADASRQRGVPGAEATLGQDNAANPARARVPRRVGRRGGGTHPPKNVSLTDPASQWTAAPGGPAFFACSTNHLIDTKVDVIVDVEASPAHRMTEVMPRARCWSGPKRTWA